MKKYLLKREAVLLKALGEVTKRQNHASRYKDFDLAFAYSAAERHLLGHIGEVQKTLMALEKEGI